MHYDEVEMVCMSLKYFLFKILMLQKIRKNKDVQVTNNDIS